VERSDGVTFKVRAFLRARFFQAQTFSEVLFARVFWVAAGMGIFVLGVICFTVYWRERLNLKQGIRREVRIASIPLIHFLLTEDYTGLYSVGERLLTDPNLTGVRIYDLKGSLLYRYGNCSERTWTQTLETQKGQQIARIQVCYSLRLLHRQFVFLVLVLLLSGGGGLLFLWIFIRQGLQKGLHPLRELAETLREAPPGSLQNLPWCERKDELGILARALVQRDLSLAQQQSLLRLLWRAVENTQESIVIADRKGRILYVNPACEAVTGWKREELQGKTPAVFKSGLHSREFYQELWQTILSGKTWEGIFINRKRNGEIYYERASISPIKDEKGEITHFIAVKRDITREKLLEERLREAQKMEALGALAGGLAHQMNNFLMGLKTRIERLRLHYPDLSELKEMDELVAQSAETIRELLLFARREKFELKPLSLHALLRDFLRSTRKLLRENIRVEPLLEARKDTVRGNSQALKQALMNLLLNAQEAMPEGGKIFFRTYNRGSKIVLEVGDTGPGIPPQNLTRIFDPFFTTKGPNKGTGLGLAVVYGIVKAHEGDIQASNRAQGGALFKLTFPLCTEKPLETDEEKPAEGFEKPWPRRGPRTILLVEDEEEVLQGLKELLEMQGLKVFTATTLEEARQEFRKHEKEIEAVLTDEVLPDGQGSAWLKEIRARHPDLPLILATGYTEKDLSFVQKEGIFFLRKPYSLKDLEKILGPFR